MPIKRIQSAPQPIESFLTSTKAKVAIITSENSALPRSKSYLLNPSNTQYSPRTGREDPFNLGGFFPVSSRTAPEEQQWKWLHRDEDVDEDAYEDAAVPSFAAEEDEFDMGELHAAQTIQNEDKLGVLSLNTIFSRKEFNVDDHFSPYSEDEPVDYDSLYLSLCARRQASAGVTQQEAAKMGSLFFPGKEEIDNSWSGAIMRRVF